jgi:hypothetical protein
VVTWRAALRVDPVAQHDDDQTITGDNNQRRSGETGVTVTAAGRRSHEVWSINHPSETTRLRQSWRLIGYRQGQGRRVQERRRLMIAPGRQPGAAKCPEITGSAEETGMPGDASEHIRAFVVNDAVNQAATPFPIKLGWCNMRDQRRIGAEASALQSQWSADQFVNGSVERLTIHGSDDFTQQQRIDVGVATLLPGGRAGSAS